MAKFKDQNIRKGRRFVRFSDRVYRPSFGKKEWEWVFWFTNPGYLIKDKDGNESVDQLDRLKVLGRTFDAFKNNKNAAMAAFRYNTTLKKYGVSSYFNINGDIRYDDDELFVGNYEPVYVKLSVSDGGKSASMFMAPVIGGIDIRRKTTETSGLILDHQNSRVFKRGFPKTIDKFSREINLYWGGWDNVNNKPLKAPESFTVGKAFIK